MYAEASEDINVPYVDQSGNYKGIHFIVILLSPLYLCMYSVFHSKVI